VNALVASNCNIQHRNAVYKGSAQSDRFLSLMRESGDIWVVSPLQCKKIHSFASSVGENLGMHSDNESAFFANASAIGVSLTKTRAWPVIQFPHIHRRVTGASVQNRHPILSPDSYGRSVLSHSPRSRTHLLLALHFLASYSNYVFVT
jgi:hypothetical protein